MRLQQKGEREVKKKNLSTFICFFRFFFYIFFFFFCLLSQMYEKDMRDLLKPTNIYWSWTVCSKSWCKHLVNVFVRFFFNFSPRFLFVAVVIGFFEFTSLSHTSFTHQSVVDSVVKSFSYNGQTKKKRKKKGIERFPCIQSISFRWISYEKISFTFRNIGNLPRNVIDHVAIFFSCRSNFSLFKFIVTM